MNSAKHGTDSTKIQGNCINSMGNEIGNELEVYSIPVDVYLRGGVLVKNNGYGVY